MQSLSSYLHAVPIQLPACSPYPATIMVAGVRLSEPLAVQLSELAAVQRQRQ
jgi:hypothetical protein